MRPTNPQSLVMKHPDIKSNHVIAVLSMRGDLNKSLVTKVRSSKADITHTHTHSAFPTLVGNTHNCSILCGIRLYTLLAVSCDCHVTV